MVEFYKKNYPKWPLLLESLQKPLKTNDLRDTLLLQNTAGECTHILQPSEKHAALTETVELGVFVP